MSEAPYYELSAFSNVEWDRAFLCPEFMALWMFYDYEFVKKCSSNLTTGEPLPEEMYRLITKSSIY